MNRNNLLKISLISIALFSITACSKYEEGKASMRTKKSRLCQKWKVDAARVVWEDGSAILDVTADYTDASLEFEKDGSYSMIQYGWSTSNPPPAAPDFKEESIGSWEFFNDKTQLYTDQTVQEIYIPDNSIIDESEYQDQIWRIVKLQKDELKVWFWWPGNQIQHVELDLSVDH